MLYVLLINNDSREIKQIFQNILPYLLEKGVITRTELLVVDDSGEDATQQALHSWQDQVGFTLLRHEQPQGLGVILHEVLKLAHDHQFDWVFFLDGDALAAEDLRTALSTMDEKKGEADIVWGQIHTGDHTKKFRDLFEMVVEDGSYAYDSTADDSEFLVLMQQVQESLYEEVRNFFLYLFLIRVPEQAFVIDEDGVGALLQLLVQAKEKKWRLASQDFPMMPVRPARFDESLQDFSAWISNMEHILRREFFISEKKPE